MEIYQDQEALLISPEKKQNKNEKIFSFFVKGIYLYIEKRYNECEAYCHLVVHESSERDRGLYIVHKDIYTNEFFTKFKNEATKNLSDLKFKNSGIRNIELDRLEDLDTKETHIQNIQNTKLFSDGISIDDIAYALKDNHYLEYRGGIDHIIKLSRELMKLENIKIMICRDSNETRNGSIDSSNLSLYQQISFIIDKSNDSTSLIPTERTKGILERYMKIIKENKKKDDGKPGIYAIDGGADKMKEGIQILAKAGYSNKEIKNILGKSIDDVRSLADIVHTVPIGEYIDGGNSGGINIRKLIIIIIVTIVIMIIVFWKFWDKIITVRQMLV